VENVLGILGILLFIVCVIALAAGITWVVVRFSPKPGSKNKQPAEN
jgi:hypothetical protein